MINTMKGVMLQLEALHFQIHMQPSGKLPLQYDLPS